jgi:hypothetical protein
VIPLQPVFNRSRLLRNSYDNPSLQYSELPFASGIHGVTYFRQALALDEHRARFIPEYRHLDPLEKPQLPFELAESSSKIQSILAEPSSSTNNVQAQIEALLAKDPRLDMLGRMWNVGLWVVIAMWGAETI